MRSALPEARGSRAHYSTGLTARKGKLRKKPVRDTIKTEVDALHYHIDTIPVWDAFKAGGECPLCSLQEKNEQDYLDSFLGASVMEPATRVEVNEKGFCARHLSQMFGMKNRLGLSLMLHTHLKETLAKMEPPEGKKKSLFRGRAEPEGDEETCVLCERLNATMDRYVFTVLHLFRTDAEFRRTFEQSLGFCLPHYRRLVRMARQEMSEKDQGIFLPALYTLEKANLERIEKEIEWFTLKFDYRNADKPWGNSKDAAERTVNKLRGKCVHG